jgi:ribulose 1,5-bisphosphate synthetase/thiazole synthase
MDSLQDILSKRDFRPPDDFTVVREYVLRRYKSKCYVKIQRDALILTVGSSGLAATLQLDRQRLIEACNLKKKLVIRSGSVS